MKPNDAVQWLVCLMLGGITGYQLRSPSIGAAMPGPTTEVAASKDGQPGFGPSLSGEGAGSKKKEGDATSGKMSLGERMKSLMENGYASKSAKKAIEALSEPELQASLALLANMPKSNDRDLLRTSLFAAWAKLNPNAAWKSAVALDTGDYPSYVGAVAGELAKTRPSAAMDLALSLGMGNKRSSAMRSIFSEWGKVDGAAAVDYLNKHPDLPAGFWTMNNAISELAEKDPARAGSLALTFSDQQVRSNAIRNVLRRWSAGDPKAALAWAEKLGNVTLQQEAVADALGGWAAKDPNAAMAAAQAIKDPSQRSKAMGRALSAWFENDPSAAITFLGSAGDDKLFDQLRWRISSGEFTPEETSSMMAKLPEGTAKDSIVRSVVETAVTRGQYTRAIEQLNSLPDSSSRDYTLQYLGKQWAEMDPKAAESWIKLQPDSSDRDVAVSGFASALARTNVQSALQWAETIPDQDVRSGTLKNIVHRWLTSDPAKANAWLDKSSGWSADDIQRVREYNQKYGPDQFSHSVSVKKRH